MMAKSKSKKPVAKPQRRNPSEHERKAIEEANRSFECRPSRPMCSLAHDEQANTIKLAAGHNNEDGFEVHLAETLGSRSPGFRRHLVHLIGNSMISLGGGLPSEDAFNAAFAILGAIGPEDEVEAALGAQIAATNDLSLQLLAAAKRSSSVDLTSSYINQATKLQRTMCAQLDTLTKMRRGGEQVVRHIHVDNRGGQAVIAENLQTRGLNEKLDDQCHEQCACGPALLGQDAFGHALPMPSSKEQEAVPAPWRDQSGRTEGQ